MFYVYVHTVPNGKLYIGEAKNILMRWNNGEGYSDNVAFYKDINLYGWNNIRHEIIAEFDDRESALRLESVLIVLFKTENPDYGYNQTDIYKKAMKKWNYRHSFETFVPKQGIAESGFFEQYNIPISASKELINQWIYNQRNRYICERRLIDGLSYDEISNECKMSVRQIKNVISKCCDILSKHL